MNTLNVRKSWIALLVILSLFAACKGESPTAPPPGGGTPTSPTTPPVGVSLALATSNTDPLVDSQVTITATVTQNNAPVPNGTAVEFVATAGALDGGGTGIIKTTTNGVATVTLTSGAAGTVRVQATVNNVSRTIDVNFRARPVTQPPPDTAPTISSITPAIGRPAGGETLRITGTNFREPVRVLFDVGRPLPVEASVIAVTPTTIDVVTPPVDLGAGQQLVADIIVLNEAGTTREQRLVREDSFTFRAEQLTPRISTATPNSGPVTGGTIVKIFGDGFQAPVQVLFGTAEARVLEVHYGEIVIETPAARDTSPTGSGTVVGPVDITVRNINSQTVTTLASGFHYKAALQITAVSPSEGLFTGGTRVQIDGVGFLAPVAVTIGGVPAQPISVSGTRIIALTGALELTGCEGVSGPVIVTNVANGDTAVSPTSFIYRVPPPTIIAVSPSRVTAGSPITVTVANAQPGLNRIKLGDRTVFPTASVIAGDGTGTFSVTVPTNFDFGTEACTVDGIVGVRDVEILLDVTYQNVASGCTDTADDALTVDPLDTTCQLPPPPNATLTPVTPPCINVGSVASAGTTTGETTFTVTNTGGRPLVISSAAPIAGSVNLTSTTVTPGSGTVAPQASLTFTVNPDPAAAGAFSGTIRVNSNDPDTPAIDFCFTGNGT